MSPGYQILHFQAYGYKNLITNRQTQQLYDFGRITFSLLSKNKAIALGNCLLYQKATVKAAILYIDLARLSTLRYADINANFILLI